MGNYYESHTVELKERMADTVAKEIVAFLNADGGKLFIGINDKGVVVGLEKLDESYRELSDIITMQIEPNPQNEIKTEVFTEDGKKVILVNVNKGFRNVYCLKKYGFSPKGCPIRIGSTCKEMTPEQIRNRYEQNFTDNEYMLKKRASRKELSFRELKIYYTEKGFHIADNGSFEVNLNLRDQNGDYNLLAELLADKNSIPFIFVKFNGQNKAAISERTDFGYGCILTAYTRIKSRLIAENICVTNTTVRPREDRYLYDIDSVNEALLNAIVHNDWTITEPQISMFNNRIEILSHGGLPNGMTEDEFFEGVSKPRNATLMRIFLSMGLVEHTGHGIPTIIERYGKEVFQISKNYIRCVLPFDQEVVCRINNAGNNAGNEAGNGAGIPVGNRLKLRPSEKKILCAIIENPDDTSIVIAEKTGLNIRTVEKGLAHLKYLGLIERIGTKRDGRWIVIK